MRTLPAHLLSLHGPVAQAADPAVKAGRLKVEVVTWYVGKGYMTFPKAPAPAAPR